VTAEAPARRVLVLGSLNMDLLVQVPRLPAPGETIAGGKLLTAPGGKGANQAVAARRLGATVAMLGRVGDDAFGSRMVEGLLSEGIDVSLIGRSASPTGVALITVDAHGENTIALAPGANAELGPVDLEAAASRIVEAEVCVAQLEVPVDTVAAAFRVARAAGVPTLLNAAPARALPDALLADTTVCILNAGELAHVAGSTSPAGLADDARSLLARGTAAVVVTDGPGDTLALTSDGTVLRVAPPRVEPLDTVGAGDAFVGCLAAVYAGLEPNTLAKAIASANVAGALATQQRGAQPSLPTRAAVFGREAAGRA
jgi:ribokinase